MGNGATKEEFQTQNIVGSGPQTVGRPPIPCPPGTYGGTLGQTSSQCSGKCNAGYYCTAGSTVPNQTPCPSGYYCLEGTGDPLSANPPAPCAAGTSSPSGASVCTACESGKSSQRGGLCGPCAAGTYSQNTCVQPPEVFVSQVSPPGPRNLPPPGVQMWYDGNDVDGDGTQRVGVPGFASGLNLIVSTWRDKSGFARHATTYGEPNVTNFPADSPSGPGAMTFNRTKLIMAEASYGNTNLFSTALHMFVVIKEVSPEGREPGDSTPLSFGLGSIFDPFDNRRTFPANSIDITTSREYDLRTKHDITIWEVLIFQESEATSYYREWFNGVPVVFDAASTALLTRFKPMNTTSNLYIANRVSGTTGQRPRGWTGFIYDIVIYNRALPTSERELVQGFLARKWEINTSLPPQHPYRLTAPPITNLVSPPMKPLAVRAVLSSTGLTVNWLGGEGATSYIITLNSSTNTYTIPISGTNIYTTTLTTIQPGVTYFITVTAVNLIGPTISDSIEVTYFDINVSTVAGRSGSGTSSIDGTTTQFIFTPFAVVSDTCGSLFVADGNNLIRKIFIRRNGSGTSSMVTTFVGGVSSGTTSPFNRPKGLAIDGENNIYVADTNNHSIRKISPQGVVTLLAGSSTIGYHDSPNGATTLFQSPIGIAVDYAGIVYVADTGNNLIRKITPAGAVTTLAGTPGAGESRDGLQRNARFNAPSGLTVDSFGNVYVADTGNHVIRKITPAGAVTTVAGLAGAPGLIDGKGQCARFNAPVSITIDSNGALYVCEQGNNTIRKIVLTSGSTSSSGTGSIPCSTTNSDTATVTTIAGNGSTGAVSGKGIASTFNRPSGLCFDPVGHIYLADTQNNTVRMITILPLVKPAQPITCITLCKPCCAGTTSTPGSSLCTPSAVF